MIVRLLGPVQVVGPRGRAVLSGRQRALVGLLALRTGTVLVPARVVDALWGENPPRTAVKSLHSHVARVRGALYACAASTWPTSVVGAEIHRTPRMYVAATKPARSVVVPPP